VLWPPLSAVPAKFKRDVSPKRYSTSGLGPDSYPFEESIQ
jgi:hypothetical protein